MLPGVRQGTLVPIKAGLPLAPKTAMPTLAIRLAPSVHGVGRRLPRC
jgi:hypothetical protein